MKTILIPDAIMIPAVNQIAKESGKGPDSWFEAEKTSCRRLLPEKFHYIESDWIGKRAINLRKRGVLDGIRGGRTKQAWKNKCNPWYLEYTGSTDYDKRVRKPALMYWGFRCALDCRHKKNLEVHHRTYVRVPGHELFTDVVVLCRECHGKLHHRMPSPPRSKPNGNGDGPSVSLFET